jgi:hypothetical protein
MAVGAWNHNLSVWAKHHVDAGIDFFYKAICTALIFSLPAAPYSYLAIWTVPEKYR